METGTMSRIIENVYKDLEDGDEVTFIFQGGEPTLAGLDWFKRFTGYAASLQRNVKVNYALQTNGLLIDDSWAEFLHDHNFLTGLSIDAGAAFHDSNRLDTGGAGTWKTCLQSKALLEKHGAEYNILCVLTNELAGDPDKAWRFILNEKIRFIQFIPCLGSLDESEAPSALRPARFARFYSRLYYWWLKELEKGSYISIKFFDDTASFFLRGIPAACGIDGQCRSQYVVEADGSVYPCDFYVLDHYNAGNLTRHTLGELSGSEKMRAFLQEERNLPELCLSCGYLKMCGGGCKRMRDAVYYGSAGSVCGYRIFLEKCLKPLEYTVRKFFPLI
jgi:uncharacterized protein